MQRHLQLAEEDLLFSAQFWVHARDKRTRQVEVTGLQQLAPMRRIVQSSIENIVAKEVLAGNLKSGGEINITTTMIRQEIGE